MTFVLILIASITIYFVIFNTWRLSRISSLLLAICPAKPKIHSALTLGDPIEPTVITDEKFSLKTTEKERLFYNDLTDFSVVINTMYWGQFTRSPWRLQELADTELNPTSFDRSFKRRYDIFYNQARVGKIELSPASNYSAEQPYVYTDINLQFVRLITFDAVNKFLSYISYLFIAKGDYLTRENAITLALTKSLWETQNLFYDGSYADDWGDLALSFEGPALRYFSIRDSLREERAAQAATRR